jgi:hypothetical protein
LLPLVILSSIALAFVAAAYVLRARQGLAALRRSVECGWDDLDALLLARRDELQRFDAGRARDDPAFPRLREADAAVHAARARRDVTAVGIAEEHLRSALAALGDGTDVGAPARDRLAAVRALTDRIAAGRDAYNDAVNLYNIRLRSWPEAALGRLEGWRPAPLLEYPGN